MVMSAVQAREPRPGTSMPFIATLIRHQQDVLVSAPGLRDTLPVRHVAETVTTLADGDKVLCLLDDALGVVVTDRIVPMADSAPATDLITELENGQLLFDAPRGLILQTGDARIELRPDGCLLLDGQEIHAIADGINRLLGARIELN
ncbi:MAG: hypothetical protein VX793_00600 [Pseudomonadota bacterium]|nr:hypothetical protein [Pseudomonadota bacterium]